MPQKLLHDALWHVVVDHPRADRMTESVWVHAAQRPGGIARAVPISKPVDCDSVTARRDGTALSVGEEPGHAVSPSLADGTLLLLNGRRQFTRDRDLQLLSHLGLVVAQEVVALSVTGEAIKG